MHPTPGYTATSAGRPVRGLTSGVSGLDRCCIVSDAASLAGLPPGIVKWMGKDISIEQEAHGLVIRDPEFRCLVSPAYCCSPPVRTPPGKHNNRPASV